MKLSLLFATALLACSAEVNKKPPGDPCQEDNDCATEVCRHSICSAASPAAVGAACKADVECLSFSCVSGVCATGTRPSGAVCYYNAECLSNRCLIELTSPGACAAVVDDGGVRDAGGDVAASDAAGPDAARLDAARLDAAQGDASPPDAPVPDAPVPDAPVPDAPVPDAPVPDVPPPDVAFCPNSCDDKLSCTTDSCSDGGVCVHELDITKCLIGGSCHDHGKSNPLNDCEICDANKSQTAWSTAPNNTPCNDGVLCTHSDVCTSGACKGTVYSCDDGLACTDDACNGKAPPLGCDKPVLKAGFCLVGGTCHAKGATDPTDKCRACDPAQSTSGFVPAPISGCVVNVAGTCNSGGHLNGPAKTAKFSGPKALALHGNKLFIADSGNNCVRVLDLGTNLVTDWSGVCQSTYGYQDGAPQLAKFRNPAAMVIDGSGVIYLSDQWGSYVGQEGVLIRKINANGFVSTLAGATTEGCVFDTTTQLARFTSVSGMDISTGGQTLYVADAGCSRLLTISGGQVTTIAGAAGIGHVNGDAKTTAKIKNPVDVALAGNKLYFADSGNHAVRQLTLTGSPLLVSDVAGSPGVYGNVDGGPPAVGIPTFGYLRALDTDSSSNVVILTGITATGCWPPSICKGWGRLRYFNATKDTVTRLAGNTAEGVIGNAIGDGLTKANFGRVRDVVVDTTKGWVYYPDESYHCIRKYIQ